MCVLHRLSEVDEKTAVSVLAGVAYMAQGLTPTPPATPALSPAISGRLAKMAAKKAAKNDSTSETSLGVPLDDMVTELLQLAEGRVSELGGHALEQLATAVSRLRHAPDAKFASNFRAAVSNGVARCGNYPGLAALTRAAAGGGATALALPATKAPEGVLAADKFAQAVAEQAVRLSKGPGMGTLGTVEEGMGGDGMAMAADLLAEPEVRLQHTHTHTHTHIPARPVPRQCLGLTEPEVRQTTATQCM